MVPVPFLLQRVTNILHNFPSAYNLWCFLPINPSKQVNAEQKEDESNSKVNQHFLFFYLEMN